MDHTFIEEQRIKKVRKRVKAMAGFYKHLAAYIVVNIVLIAMHWADLKPGEEFFTFSTFSTAFFWGIGLLFHGFGAFGVNLFLGPDWEERKIQEYMDRNAGTKEKWE